MTEQLEDQSDALYPFPPIDARMLGNRLRMARKLAGYESAETFAAVLRERMGVTNGGNPIQGHTLRAIERGDQDATFQLIAATVALTGVDLEWYTPAIRPDVMKLYRDAKGI